MLDRLLRWPAATNGSSLSSRGRAAASMVVCVAALMPSVSHAGLFDDEEARKAILALRAQLEAQQKSGATLQEQVAALQEQVATLRRGILDLNNQIESNRAESAKLRGQDEQTSQMLKDLARDLAEFQRKQKDNFAAVDERLRKFEPQKVTVDGREGTVETSERRAFEDALVVLRRGEFPSAIAAFQSFGTRFPDSLYAGQAKYWLGSAQYGKGDLRDAAATFKSFVASAPDHPRAPDAMLSLSNCQAELKDVKGARKTLEDLLKQYPQSEAAKAGRDRLALLR